MTTRPHSKIATLVAHLGGPTAVSLLLAGLARQEIGRWVQRGYVSPKHLPAVVEIAEGVVTEDGLRADIRKFKKAEAVARIAAL